MLARWFNKYFRSSLNSIIFTSPTHILFAEQLKMVRLSDVQRSVYTVLLLYTHIGLQDDRQDLSHPVHADNCILDEKKGECNKIPPAYTWRDYRYKHN